MTYGCGSKLNHQGTTGFSLRFQFEVTLFLTHNHIPKLLSDVPARSGWNAWDVLSSLEVFFLFRGWGYGFLRDPFFARGHIF